MTRVPTKTHSPTHLARPHSCDDGMLLLNASNTTIPDSTQPTSTPQTDHIPQNHDSVEQRRSKGRLDYRYQTNPNKLQTPIAQDRRYNPAVSYLEAC